jgi:hypothetical protein
MQRMSYLTKENVFAYDGCMQKKFVPAIIFLVLLATAIPPLVSAEETTTATTSSSITPSHAIKETVRHVMDEKRQKLQEKRDEKKAAMATKLSTKISSVNQKRTAQMAEALLRMRKLLTKVQTKAQAAKQNGADITETSQAIASAEAAITTAQQAVAIQAQKPYSVTATGTTADKEAFGQLVKSMQNDLQTTHTSVLSAKKAVQHAIETLAKVRRFIKNTDKADKQHTASEAAQ